MAIAVDGLRVKRKVCDFLNLSKRWIKRWADGKYMKSNHKTHVTCIYLTLKQKGTQLS